MKYILNLFRIAIKRAKWFTFNADFYGYYCMQLLGKDVDYLFPGSSYGIFYIFIPQAIYQGIQHWDNESVKYGRHFISLK